MRFLFSLQNYWWFSFRPFFNSRKLLSIFAGLCFSLSVQAFAQSSTSAPVLSLAAAHGYVISIRGTINPATSRYLERAIEQATSESGKFLLVELDTPGGLVSSVREMAQSIDKSKIPVLVYTTPAGAAATSAGALLMISSHLAVMSPGTNIGAAHPVGPQGEDIKGAMAEKAVNDISAFARSMAELRKRNAIAASEVVTKSNSFTAEEALKNNLIEIIAADRKSLFEAIDQRQLLVHGEQMILNTAPAPELLKIDMTLGEKILNGLSHPNIAALLMSLGMLLIYFELSAPGIGLGGILGGLCLIVGFIAFQSIPIHLGGMLLLGLGALLIVAEVFVVSGGALAGGGSIAVLFGLLWVVDPVATDLRISPWLIGTISVVLFGGSLLIAYGVSQIKSQSASARRQVGGGDSAGLRGYKVNVYSLNPNLTSGQVMVRGELWGFVSSETLKQNDSVIIQRTNGLTLEVTRDKES